MSTGRYRMMWTFLADLLGLLLSYLYGRYIPVWIGRLLVSPYDDVRRWAVMLYTILLTPLSMMPSLHSAYRQNAGLTWITIAILLRLLYLLHYLYRRGQKNDLAQPYAGNPGDQYYETVKRRLKEYNASIQRWKPPFSLRMPTWRYYTRRQTTQPDLIWRGRTLIIEKGLLAPERVQELRPYLARELMYYNCEDVAYMDILAHYPKKPHLLLELTGLGVFLPVVLIYRLLWPKYWQERNLVADDFAYGLGQGNALYVLLDAQAKQEETLRQQCREIAHEIMRQEHLLDVFQKKEAIHDWQLPDGDQHARSSRSGENAETQFRLRLNQTLLYVEELKKRERELRVQEQRIREVRPMLLDERVGQLRARLATEQRWKERRGIRPPASTVPLSTQQTPRRLQRGPGDAG